MMDATKELLIDYVLYVMATKCYGTVDFKDYLVDELNYTLKEAEVIFKDMLNDVDSNLKN